MDRGPNDQPTEAKGEHVVLFAEADPFLTKYSNRDGSFSILS